MAILRLQRLIGLYQLLRGLVRVNVALQHGDCALYGVDIRTLVDHVIERYIFVTYFC